LSRGWRLKRRLDCLAELADILVTLIRVLGHGLEDQAFEGFWQIRPAGARADDHTRRGRLPGQYFEKQYAQGVNVGAGIHHSAQNLLGRQVGRWRLGYAGRRPEIGQKGLLTGVQQDIARLEVAMHVTLVMDIF
jgi:hypothetical protein